MPKFQKSYLTPITTLAAADYCPCTACNFVHQPHYTTYARHHSTKMRHDHAHFVIARVMPSSVTRWMCPRTSTFQLFRHERYTIQLSEGASTPRLFSTSALDTTAVLDDDMICTRSCSVFPRTGLRQSRVAILCYCALWASSAQPPLSHHNTFSIVEMRSATWEVDHFHTRTHAASRKSH